MTDDQSGLSPARRVPPRRKARGAEIERAEEAGAGDAGEREGEDAGPAAEVGRREIGEHEPLPPSVQLTMTPPAQPVRAELPALPAVEQPPAAPESAPAFDFPRTMRETLNRVDQAWSAFHTAARRFPLERLNEPVGNGGWTRKQMLSHIAAWHDLTADRMVKLVNTGTLPQPDDRTADEINAFVARQAVGKTAGEILKDIDTTFNRLRRQLDRVTDAQLEANDWEVAYVIGGNTYGHYEEHWADVHVPGSMLAGGRARR